MITKQCAGCGRYFAGQFDGDYTCAECHQLGAVQLRPLSPLGVQFAGSPSDTEAQPGRFNARGQAA